MILPEAGSVFCCVRTAAEPTPLSLTRRPERLPDGGNDTSSARPLKRCAFLAGPKYRRVPFACADDTMKRNVKVSVRASLRRDRDDVFGNYVVPFVK